MDELSADQLRQQMDNSAELLLQTVAAYNSTLHGYDLHYRIMANTPLGFVYNISLLNQTTREKVSMTNFLCHNQDIKEEILKSLQELSTIMGM